ncbi:sigma-70 family RNA polymerase sigma factor [Rapidithrix thailandica]|uniref:Sigma-70 family RNA polymerase sigma factor n=1 Tax=Rapidithrix thailandica TaxID=413964 RepID=A0AAW9S6R3_9BACT
MSDTSSKAVDENLWNSLRKGSVDALDQMYQQHYQLLYSFGYKCIPDGELVKDSIQELFIKLWKKHAHLKKVHNVRGYLLRALYNTIISQKKTYGHHEPLPDFDQYKYQVVFSSETQVISQEQKDENSQKLNRALKGLSKREREIIYLFFYEGYSYQEIEEQTQLQYQSIKNVMYRALQRLKSGVLITGLFFYLLK